MSQPRRQRAQPLTRATTSPISTFLWVVPVVVAIATVVAFLPALRAGFVSWDDDKNFLNNPYYRGLGFTQLRWMWSTFLLGHYVPLSWMSLGLDFTLWGMNPAGYHLTSLLLHTANAVLVYLLARRLLGFIEADPIRLALASAVAALSFSIHPLRVESVAWITERRDVLSYLFYLSSALSYLRFVDATDSRRRWYACSLAAFACALLSKATSVTLPAVLLIMNAWPLARLDLSPGGLLGARSRQVYRELAPFVVLAAGIVVMTFIALQHLAQLNATQKVAVSAYGVAFYLWKTIAPASLAPLYTMPRQVNPVAARYLVSYLVIAAVSALAWFARRRSPVVTATWLAFLVAVFPMLGLVQNGPQIAADRYTYFAAPFLGVLAAAGLLRLPRALLVAGSIVTTAVLFAFGTLTWNQAGIWRDSLTLWTRVVDVEPAAPIAHNNIGNLSFQARRYNESIQHYQQAVTLQPDYAEAHNNLGVAYSRVGRLADAIAEYQRALAIAPFNDQARENWGLALAEEGKVAEAIEQYRLALVINPENADILVNWGSALLQRGDVAGAVAQYMAALTLRPDSPDAYVNLGVALAREGKLVQAVEKFRQALALQPDHVAANEYLQKSLAVLRAQPGAQ